MKITICLVSIVACDFFVDIVRTLPVRGLAWFMVVVLVTVGRRGVKSLKPLGVKNRLQIIIS